MHHLISRFLCSALRSKALIAAVALASLLTQPVAARAKVPSTLLEQRAITMQGLSIGLAMVTLTSQLNTVYVAGATQGDCVALVGRGSAKTLSKTTNGGSISARVRFYFDDQCSSVYLDEALEMKTSPQIVLDAKIKVFNKVGKKVATFTLIRNTIVSSGQGNSRLFGTGKVEPVGKNAPTLHLALNCELPPVAKKAFAFDCEGASVQDFKDVGKSIAARTRAKLRITASGQVDLSQNAPGITFVGKLGALSVKVDKAGSIAIEGRREAWSSDQLSGRFDEFSLFPPKGTSWSLLDSGMRSTFAIEVLDTTTHAMRGSVKRPNGKKLASFRLDASGSGSIAYSDGVEAKIASWALAR